MANELFLNICHDHYVAMILPKDILKYAVQVNGLEAERSILEATKEYVSASRVEYSDPIGRFGLSNPINVVNGDTIEFTWNWVDDTGGLYVKDKIGFKKIDKIPSPEKVIFHATGSGSVYTKRI